MGDFPLGFGRYQLVERLAIGGMAELFVATAPGEHGFQKKVVIKRLLPHLVEDETYNAMFIDEAKLTARLVHPKIAQTFELGKVEGALYIAMEHVDGIDVLALLREYAAKRRRVEPQMAAWIAHEVLDALDYAHNIKGEDGKALGIVHRDISPSNVLLSTRGDIKLVDFGIARAVDPERAHKSKSGTLKGKYGYMSPEQVIELPLDARSDLFSVGVVLAELLTGRRLFAAANELDVLLMVRDAKLTRLDKYGQDIEPELAQIVRTALRKPVDERWQSAAAFRDALAEWLFEHRHRVTSRQVAQVVHELRDAVVERRQKNLSHAPGNVPVAVDEPAVPRAQSEDAPLVMLEPGDSMPVISMSYDASASEGIKRPITVTDLSQQAAAASSAAAATPASARAETVPARPVNESSGVVRRAPTDSDRKVSIPSPAEARSGPIRIQSAPVAPRTATGSGPPLSRIAEGVIDMPIADTISAAVEAITLPDLLGSSDPAVKDDDSMMRAFDDITEPPSRIPLVRPPTEEEALRKKPPTPPALADIAEPPDDSGEFHLTSPLRVLFRLMTARATGLLVVAVGGIKKEIYVRDGQPEYVSSNVASELFGNYLVTKGVLSDGELAMALAMMPHYGGKLGDTLVGLGLLKPLEVFRHLTRQVRTKIIDVCTWNKGSFGWYAGRENPREAFPLDFNAFEILGAGAMALSDDFVESWIAKHGSMRLRASRTRRVGPERFEVKGLVELCDLLDGRRSVGDLVELQPDRTERLRVGRMLCLLEACDLARPA
ncbi:MAG TPA: serine/threonine-protein kinase [Kofleriaceae bacterium]|nr:serine/threonine-protein kinase [Kofleriaceae bacterium]